ncbi:MAG: CBS domain-containing protein [Myxococcales bacterium]|nr:CBS domain-containing protein [Myxococcales bacterium]
MQRVLADVRALEQMLDTDLFETGDRRIGAEQEMFLVDECERPAPVAEQLLASVSDERLTQELGRFNLEANISPRLFRGDCLRAMEAELLEVVNIAREAATPHRARVVLSGILPTLRKTDLTLENMMPSPRYRALNDALARIRGGDFRVRIQGVDELETTHDNVMMESCNTSFQIHFQVAPSEFVRLYNVSQVVTAPVLAAATNSPVFLGRRLWNETRIALFMGAIDARSAARHARGQPPRVTFGTSWLRDSVLEIYREQIARFRVVLSSDDLEDPMEALRRGEPPSLAALRLFSGTVYRWNRACYGVSGGKAHLRIENRVLPAGPTLIDEVANAALFFGLMSALPEEHADVTKDISFEDAKDNFFRAARHGLDAQMTWFGGEALSASELILDRLLPLARAGLERSEIDAGDVDRYLGVIEDRVKSRQTGASWLIRSIQALPAGTTLEMRDRSLVAGTLERQLIGDPVHTWKPLHAEEQGDWRESYRTVGQFMSTDLFTVRPEDLIDLAASVMDWEHIRHVPVEDDEGHLRGVISHRMLLRLLTRPSADRSGPIAVRDIMKEKVVTVRPDTPTLDAMHLMRRAGVGCLPVVEDGRLVGIITEHDLIQLSATLLESALRE